MVEKETRQTCVGMCTGLKEVHKAEEMERREGVRWAEGKVWWDNKQIQYVCV